MNVCFSPSSSVIHSWTVPIIVGSEVPVAAPTMYIEGTELPMKRVLSLQMCPVAE